MNLVIKDILERDCSKDDKLKALNSLSVDIQMAKEIISGKYKYCPECDDFYLSKSFLTEHETKEGKVCIYNDPINSGGNDYADGYIDINYEICPKGHKHETERKERVE